RTNADIFRQIKFKSIGCNSKHHELVGCAEKQKCDIQLKCNNLSRFSLPHRIEYSKLRVFENRGPRIPDSGSRSLLKAHTQSSPLIEDNIFPTWELQISAALVCECV